MADERQIQVDKKWQKKWEDSKIFEFKEDPNKEKFYCLDMFPYPSGEPHCGHLRNYCLGDFMARQKRMKGYNVFLPFGFDAFGLPAENAAIERGVDPEKWTYENIDIIRDGIKKFGYSCSWGNELSTCSPDYYKWNQFIFIKLLENGLAYKKKSPVNWCPSCQTVLANEQVEKGKCERCKSEVGTRNLSQWYFKITNFADELYEDLNTLEGWSETVKQMQRNWIGKSWGGKIKFEMDEKVEDVPSEIEVFTTRPDTIYGVTFMALPPESEYVESLISTLSSEDQRRVREVVKEIQEDNLKDKYEVKEKKGAFLGHYVKHPLKDEKIPVYVANYILAEYGTGFVMGVPAHDQRDFEFASKFDIPVIPVIEPEEKGINLNNLDRAFINDGKVINSGEYNGIHNEEFKKKIVKVLEEKGKGNEDIQYKLKDWCVSRQRYWGTPIPVVYCDKCGIVPEKKENLPVKLPKDVDFSTEGNPLETSESFVNTTCPSCGSSAKRETDTMDTFVDSSWYFMRFTDNMNEEEIFDEEKMNSLMPVDQYTGGIEHAVMHLLYARFFVRAMRHSGIFNSEWKEPFVNLLNLGMVLRNGEKMSKSKGNGVNPIEYVDIYGADSVRLFILSGSAPDSEIDWTDKGIKGSYDFVKELEYFYENEMEKEPVDKIKEKYFTSRINHLIEEVDEEIDSYRFNMAFVKIRVFFEELRKFSPYVSVETKRYVFSTLLKLLVPYIPHNCEEMWEKLGYDSFISLESWPVADKSEIDKESEREHNMLLEIFSKVNKTREKKGIETVKKIKIIQSPVLRYELFEKLESILKKTRDFKEILQELKEDDRFVQDMKFIQKFVPKTLKEGLTSYIGKERERQALEEVKDILGNEFSCDNIEITDADSEEIKSMSIVPGEPGVFVE